MCEQKETTQENLNKIIEFRQAIYEQIFGKRRDALFEAWDALLLNGALTSFPMLSQHTTFQRKWHSLYKALEKGEIDAQQTGGSPIQNGAASRNLDTMPWMEPAGHVRELARWMTGNMCIFQHMR